MQNNFIHPADVEALYLIGFKLDSLRITPEVYTLFVYGDNERPIVTGGQLVFFSKPELSSRALELDDSDLKHLGPAPENVELVCDIAAMLALVEFEDVDPSATILNGLNMIFDLVKATNISFPSEYKKHLYAFADHLTFEREFASFIEQNNLNRKAIIDAILWCIGAVVTRAKILTN